MQDDRAAEAGQVDGRRQQVLIAAGVVGVGQVGLPAVAAAVAGGDGRERRQAALPFVLDAGMGEAAVVGLEVAAVHRDLLIAGRANRRRHRLADRDAPTGQGAAAGSVGIVAQVKGPHAAGVLAVEPAQAIGQLWFEDHALDHGISGRDGGFIVPGDDHLGLAAHSGGADVGENAVVVASRGTQMRVDVRHQRVIELDRDIQVGDARIAGHGDGGAGQRAGRRPDGQRRIRAGVRRAVDALSDGRVDRHAQVVGSRRPAHRGAGRVHEGVIRACRLDRHEQSFGERVGRAAGAGVVHDQDLVAGVAKQGNAETSVPLDCVSLWVQVQAQVHGVAGVGGKAEPVLLGGRGRVARPADPTVRRECIGGGGRVVGLGLRRGRAALYPQVEIVRSQLTGGRGEVVDAQVVGAGRRQRRAGDAR